MLTRYLGYSAADAPPGAMVGLADVTGFPPTLILNAEHDALRSSGEAFGAQLASAGVDVRVVKERGVFHGHLDLRPTIQPVLASYRRIGAFFESVRDDS